jgi:hypothetical protein
MQIPPLGAKMGRNRAMAGFFGAKMGRNRAMANFWGENGHE